MLVFNSPITVLQQNFAPKQLNQH